MKVCYFGAYDRGYTRNLVLIKGLRKNGVEVIECHNEASIKPLRLPVLFTKFLARAREADVIIVGACGHAYVPLARLLARVTRKPLVCDAFLSQYDTAIEDRKDFAPDHWRASLYRYLDIVAARLSDVVLLDTEDYVDYHCRQYDMPRAKFRAIPIGADDDVFRPQKEVTPHDEFRVLFVGTFIPLHGLEYVLQAASLLKGYPEIKFQIVGSGQTFPEIRKMAEGLHLSNLVFSGAQPTATCAKLMREADVSLGIFGGGSKTQRVIPCKVYEALASACALITGDTPASRSLLKDRENAILCPVADPHALAGGIIELRDNPHLRGKIARNGYELFRAKASPSVLGRELMNICYQLLEPQARHAQAA